MQVVPRYHVFAVFPKALAASVTQHQCLAVTVALVAAAVVAAEHERLSRYAALLIAGAVLASASP
jgi:hypothetical protein